MRECPACRTPGAAVYWRRKDMELAECGSCGLLFQTAESGAVKNGELIEKIYSDYTGTMEQHLAMNASRLEKMKNLLGRELKGLKVLELGPGNGALAKLLVESGAFYTGFEPYEVCRKKISSALPELMKSIIPEAFSAAALKGEKFDLVIANDALEHMADPAAALKGVRGCLKPGGRVYLEVPDESFIRVKGGIRIIFGMYGKGYPTNPDHVSLFRPESFRRLVKNSGFEAEVLKRETVWGDPVKIRIALGGKMPFYVLAGVYALRFTGLDLLLGGNITALLKDENDPDTRLSRHPLRAESPSRASGCRGSGNSQSPDNRGRQVSG